MNFKSLYLFICLISLFFSCKKDNAEPEYDYGPFNYGEITSIQSNGSVVIELQQGVSNTVVRKTKGGPQITSAGGSLILNGDGTLTIGVKNPISIQLNSGGLKNSGAVHLKQLTYSGQSATVKLDSITVDSTLTVSLTNLGDCSISGKTSYLIVSTTNLPTFFGFGLVADSCYVSHYGLNDVQVNVTKKLKGVSYSTGNTFYKGNPAVVNVNNYGSGKFIPY